MGGCGCGRWVGGGGGVVGRKSLLTFSAGREAGKSSEELTFSIQSEPSYLKARIPGMCVCICVCDHVFVWCEGREGGGGVF